MLPGDELELEVFEALTDLLAQEELGLRSKNAIIYRHKGYWSAVRDREIVTDLSIELYREGANNPFFIWIWECKDYKRQVPVDDIEEFHAKLEQIGVNRTKGTVVCRNGFQSGAVRVAEAYGIGLVRMLPDGSVIWLLEAVREFRKEPTIFGLTQQDSSQLDSMWFAISSFGTPAQDLEELVSLELASFVDLPPQI